MNRKIRAIFIRLMHPELPEHPNYVHKCKPGGAMVLGNLTGKVRTVPDTVTLEGELNSEYSL